jgi:hypothetical protein
MLQYNWFKLPAIHYSSLLSSAALFDVSIWIINGVFLLPLLDCGYVVRHQKPPQQVRVSESSESNPA